MLQIVNKIIQRLLKLLNANNETNHFFKDAKCSRGNRNKKDQNSSSFMKSRAYGGSWGGGGVVLGFRLYDSFHSTELLLRNKSYLMTNNNWCILKNKV